MSDVGSLVAALPEVVGAVFAPLFADATLTQATSTTADGQGGATAATTLSTPCKARFATAEDARRAGGPSRRERSILVLASTLGGVAPDVGDTLNFGGDIWMVIEVAGDPAEAVWTLQAHR